MQSQHSLQSRPYAAQVPSAHAVSGFPGSLQFFGTAQTFWLFRGSSARTTVDTESSDAAIKTAPTAAKDHRTELQHNGSHLNSPRVGSAAMSKRRVLTANVAESERLRTYIRRGGFVTHLSKDRKLNP
jgi:hypothetical protein